VQQGALAAVNVMREVQGIPPLEFQPRTIREALSLGGRDAVAEIGGVVVTGRSALLVKRAAQFRYIASLGGLSLLRANR
jgi:NADH dehydrogenase FAD-containing subunit